MSVVDALFLSRFHRRSLVTHVRAGQQGHGPATGVDGDAARGGAAHSAGDAGAHEEGAASWHVADVLEVDAGASIEECSDAAGAVRGSTALSSALVSLATCHLPFVRFFSHQSYLPITHAGVYDEEAYAVSEVARIKGKAPAAPASSDGDLLVAAVALLEAVGGRQLLPGEGCSGLPLAEQLRDEALAVEASYRQQREQAEDLVAAQGMGDDPQRQEAHEQCRQPAQSEQLRQPAEQPTPLCPISGGPMAGLLRRAATGVPGPRTSRPARTAVTASRFEAPGQGPRLWAVDVSRRPPAAPPAKAAEVGPSSSVPSPPAEADDAYGKSGLFPRRLGPTALSRAFTVTRRLRIILQRSRAVLYACSVIALADGYADDVDMGRRTIRPSSGGSEPQDEGGLAAVVDACGGFFVALGFPWTTGVVGASA